MRWQVWKVVTFLHMESEILSEYRNKVAPALWMLQKVSHDLAVEAVHFQAKDQ